MNDFDKLDDPRRRLLVSGLAAGVFSGAVPSSALADSIFGGRPAKLPAGQSIYRLFGSVTVNGKEAGMRTVIGPNDTVETGKNSEIVFVVGGNSMILRSESRITMQGQKSETGSFIISALRILSGKILSVSRNKGMALRTPTATIGIRGTGFYIEAEPDLTYFCTCYGKTDLHLGHNHDEHIEATHHNAFNITGKTQKSMTMVASEVIGHTDDDLRLLEQYSGRKPPFDV